MRTLDKLKAIGWLPVFGFVGTWTFVLLVFESASVIAAYYGVEHKQKLLHWAMIFGFIVGVFTYHLLLYRPMKKNLDASDDLVKSLLKKIKPEDSPNKGDADWWKHN